MIHRFAGILSAYGLALADIVCEAQEPVGKIFSEGFHIFICCASNSIFQADFKCTLFFRYNRAETNDIRKRNDDGSGKHVGGDGVSDGTEDLGFFRNDLVQTPHQLSGARDIMMTTRRAQNPLGGTRHSPY